MSAHERTGSLGTRYLPAEPNVTVPDGSDLRALLSLPSGSAAHFELPLGAVSRAGRHRTIDEIRFILSGRGEMLRRDGSFEGEAVSGTGSILISTGIDGGSCGVAVSRRSQYFCGADATPARGYRASPCSMP